MKSRVFLIVCVGAVLMLVLSSVMVYSQMRSLRAVNLDPLTDSLFREDAKILTWILSVVPHEKIDTLELPESWAEIFLVNTGDLQLTSSTNQAHKDMPLYRHPLLLDQASLITDAIKTGRSSLTNTPAYLVVIEPAGTGQILVALKPRAWEQGLVSKQSQEIETRTMGITLIMAIFLAAGLLIALAISCMVTKAVVTPTRQAMEALEALSLGNFDYDLKDAPGREMVVFTESFLRLKTTLELALEMITRR